MKLVGEFCGVPIYEENEDMLQHRIVLPENLIGRLYGLMKDTLIVKMSKEEVEKFKKQHGDGYQYREVEDGK
jgi:hypothetical protein